MEIALPVRGFGFLALKGNLRIPQIAMGLFS
jgi:hypothetical protein